MAEQQGVVGLEYIDMGLHEVDPWDGTSSLLDPGEYVFRIDKIEGGQSNAGNPKMTVSLFVAEALDEANDKHVGVTVFQSYVLDRSKDFARKRLKALTEAVGVAVDDRGGFDPNALIEGEFLAEVRRETYTVTDPVTQEKEERPSQRIFRERPVEAGNGATETAPEPPPPKEDKPKETGRGRRGRRGAPAR